MAIESELELKRMSLKQLRGLRMARTLQAQNGVMWQGINAHWSQRDPEIVKATQNDTRFALDSLQAVNAELKRRGAR